MNLDLGGDLGGDLSTLRADAHQAVAAFDAYLERARQAATDYPDPSARFAEILQDQDCPVTFEPWGMGSSMQGAEDESALQWLFRLLFEGTTTWTIDSSGSVSMEAEGGTMSAILSTIEVGTKYVIIYNLNNIMLYLPRSGPISLPSSTSTSP